MKVQAGDKITNQNEIIEVKVLELSIDEQLEMFAELLVDFYLSRYSIDPEKKI